MTTGVNAEESVHLRHRKKDFQITIDVLSPPNQLSLNRTTK